MSIPRFKDLRVGPRERRRSRGSDPAASRGRSPGRRLEDGPEELHEQLRPETLADATAAAPGRVTPDAGPDARSAPRIDAGTDARPDPRIATWPDAPIDAIDARTDAASDSAMPPQRLAEPPAVQPRIVPGLAPARATRPAQVAIDDIPLLTDVVQLSEGDVGASADGLGMGSSATAGLSADGNLEQRLTEEILQRLLRRSGHLLDAQLHDAMTPVMERLAATLARALHEPLEQMIREVVARAVTDELALQPPDSVDRTPTSRRT